MSYYDLLEAGKPLGWYLEPTEVWSYGEGCECGCKYVAVSAASPIIEHHFKTLKAVAAFYRKEAIGRGETEAELKATQQMMWKNIEQRIEKQLELRFG